MGIEPPFLYERPASYKFDTQSTDRGFNPRAHTQGEWMEAKRERARQKKRESQADGPLISAKELNRHPDSYLVVNPGFLNWKPMNPNTKSKVTWIRRVQLAIRIIGLIGAIGALVCMILIKPSGDGSDWIIRFPSGIAILHSAYGTYHLIRKPASRTPGSTASYFIFAAIFDAGLIPFMVFTLWVVRQQWILAEDNLPGGWQTLIAGPNVTSDIFLATWVASAVQAGLFGVSLFISVYLTLLFRKIAQLPPDMNPLEDNLTKRASSRHKKNKSTITQISSPVATESTRDSARSLLDEKGPQVPWMHTRNDSSSSLPSSSPTRSPGQSPRHSRYESVENLTPPRSPYRNSAVSNGSSTSVGKPQRRHGHVRNDSSGSILLPESPDRHSYAGTPPRSAKKPSSMGPYRRDTDSPSAPSVYYDVVASRSSLAVDSTWGGSAESNWFSRGADEDSIDGSVGQPAELRHLRKPPAPTTARNTDSPHAPRSKYDFTNRSPRPLEMHPPTPPIDLAGIAAGASPAQSPSYRSNRANRNRNRPALAPSNLAGNRRSAAYGELAADDDFIDAGQGDAWTAAASAATAGKVRPARVISSGYEEGVLRQGSVRSRQVSGKMVEEGHGGMQGLRAEMGWA